MTKKFEIYKCEICGNVIEVINESYGNLVCCGENMRLLEIKTEETMQEKHKPVFVINDTDIKIKVGSIPHPMTEEHHINFIEAISLDNKYLYRKYLNSGEVAEFQFFCKTDKMKARELCNIHGLWESFNQ